MFHLMLFSGWTLTHAYVFWRASSVPWIRRLVPGWVLIGAGAALYATWFLRGGSGSAGPFTRVVDVFTLNWLGILFLLATSLLAADLLTGFGLLFRRRVPALRGIALAAGAALSAVALWQGIRPPVVTRYEVSLPGLPEELDGTTVVALADMHLGAPLGAEWLGDVVDRVLSLRPDIVVLLGDISEGRLPLDDAMVRALGRLRAPRGVFGVLGNHEFHGSGSGLMEDAGIRVLRNESVSVAPGLVVAGVDDPGTQRRRGGDPVEAIRRALRGSPPGAVLYLSHAPSFAETAAAEGAGLMLSGHTHGGQLWPYGLLLRLAHHLFAGRYDVNGMTVLVSRGTGTWGPRMRLWRPAEILLITLRAP
jgi:predicted MPP superfamily phosphohydrolase